MTLYRVGRRHTRFWIDLSELGRFTCIVVTDIVFLRSSRSPRVLRPLVRYALCAAREFECSVCLFCCPVMVPLTFPGRTGWPRSRIFFFFPLPHSRRALDLRCHKTLDLFSPGPAAFLTPFVHASTEDVTLFRLLLDKFF